jgi:hypothetical protein
MSERHVLPLVAFTIFYVPLGLQTLGNWLSAGFSKRRLETKQNPQLWFFILVIAGMAICTPKLLTPIRITKQSYLDAAQWLLKNTDVEDIIAVPDPRISFYSDRRGIRYGGKTVPKEAKYVVKVVKNKKDMPADEKTLQVQAFIGDNSRRPEVIIYRQIQ